MTKNYFKLNPEWIIKEPIDFEFNKYTLLDYIQKCEKSLSNLEIYPDFIELSLHLANVHSLIKEKLIFVTEKKFDSFDDEILLKDLVPKKFRELSNDESLELSKTIKFSGQKLFDAFNVAKSIWDIAFNSITVTLRKNKNNLSLKSGYSFLVNNEERELLIWKYNIRKKKDSIEKINIKLIHKNKIQVEGLRNTLKEVSNLIGDENYNKSPIFQCISNKQLPMDNTLVPIMKRKINTILIQSKPQKK